MTENKQNTNKNKENKRNKQFPSPTLKICIVLNERNKHKIRERRERKEHTRVVKEDR
jgi:hypothetical protein